MDTTQPAKGNFVAFLNDDAKAGSKLPTFVNGRIAKPGNDEEFPFSLWAFDYTDKETGEVLTGFSGTMGPLPVNADAARQIDHAVRGKPDGIEATTPYNIALAPGRIVLFVHKPSPEHTSDKPKAHYGYANFGDDGKYVEIASWNGLTRYGKAMISGNTQYPMAKDHAQSPVVAVEVDAERGAVAGEGRKKGRGRE